MGIRNRILLVFSFSTMTLLGIAMIYVYTIFSSYRAEEWRERQKEKITSTLHFLSDFKEADNDLIQSIDRAEINDFYDEKLLIFDSEKKLIYSSIDDTPIQFSATILNRLSAKNEITNHKEGNYNVVGMYVKGKNNTYYGISKAYDKFGYNKLKALRNILLSTFFGISVLVVIVSFYISKRITQPIVDITKKINSVDLEKKFTPVEVENSDHEITDLASQFNKLMKRMDEAFAFQKYAVQHFSHELKTPIAILVSNFDRMEKEKDAVKVQAWIKEQKIATKNLAEIIDALLEISKVESNADTPKELIRMDELIFDCVEELKNVSPDFQFNIDLEDIDSENNLEVALNLRLIKLVIFNLLDNCIRYGNDNKAIINISNQNNQLVIEFKNNGEIITPEEQVYLFQHFFRGENSKGKRGFGLGLILIHKIISLEGGKVNYTSENKINQFTISFPLS